MTDFGKLVGVGVGVVVTPGNGTFWKLNPTALPVQFTVGEGVIVGVGDDVMVGVGVGVDPEVTLQSKTAEKLKSKQSLTVGVGVGQTKLIKVSSKSGQTLVLEVGPKNIVVPPLFSDNTHLVSDVL